MLKLYNYLSRKKEIFKSLKKGRIGLYTCGPTVYNYAHIGNLRTYVFEDVLKRNLEYSGYKVKHVMNLTDVDDKTIRDSQKAGKSLKEFTEFYAKEFFKDLKKLNIKPAWKYPKATGHIPEMIKLINALLKKKLAYKTRDGVYFDISKFKSYGKLSGVKKRELKAGARVDADEYSKKEAQDFALWKAKKPGEPSWRARFDQRRLAPSQRGEVRPGIMPGRPGWHIECSAMSMKYLDNTFDIHAGAVDLLFPHHEDEIAQSEGATGKPFVKHFVESEHLLVAGKKMAKSLGNFYTLRDLEAKGFSPLDFRYFVFGAHYRTQLNFTWQALEAAKQARKKLNEFINDLDTSGKIGKTIKASPVTIGSPIVTDRKLAKKLTTEKLLASFGIRFKKALAEDLDTPKALAVVWDLIRAYHKNPEKFDPASVKKLLFDFDRVLGLELEEARRGGIPKNIQALALKRESLRKEKKWQAADRIRDQIKKLGFTIEDTPSGPQIKERP